MPHKNVDENVSLTATTSNNANRNPWHLSTKTVAEEDAFYRRTKNATS